VAAGATSSDLKTGITAPVVSSVRSSPYGTFLIGAGSADGITTGSMVLTVGGFVVGVVGDTGLHASIVTELFAPGASTEVIVHGVPGTARGYGAGNARITIPRGLAITVGDPVVAPGLGQRAVAIVGEVSSSSASASEEIYIRLPVNLATLAFVYVVPPRN
jgi:cell shape-determining protein MreC